MEAILKLIVAFFKRFFGNADPVTSPEPPPTRVPTPEPPVVPVSGRENRIGHQIVTWEARTDANGHLKIYNLPAGDGGGTHEVAGLNSKYHPQIFARLIQADPADRRDMAADYIESYTRTHSGIERGSGLRIGTELAVLDCCFNRGPSGGCTIIQLALRSIGRAVRLDGEWGPQTHGELRAADRMTPDKILPAIRRARESYERRHRNESSKFWKGLVNRWNKQQKTSAAWNAERAFDPPTGGDPDPIPEWYELAEAEIGVREIKGSKHHPEIIQYWKDSELSFRDDETPWCAGYVGAMLERAGVDGTASGMARSYTRWGVKLDAPTTGCVVVFWRGSRSGSAGHVGFYAGRDRHGNIMVLGGNQSDAVNIKPFSPARLLGYYWPKGVDLPAAYPHVRTLRSDGRVSTNEA